MDLLDQVDMVLEDKVAVGEEGVTPAVLLFQQGEGEEVLDHMELLEQLLVEGVVVVQLIGYWVLLLETELEAVHLLYHMQLYRK